MGLPKIRKIWTISANNRITFVTLNDTMSKYLFGIKVFLKANGYLVKGSSNGTTGAMDAVDRWVTSANVTTQGAGSGSAQSWIVLTDGNGVDILMTYQGATADVARLSFSPGALFVASGTPQNQPTATDEVVFSSAITLINNTASADRIWFGWVDSKSQLCRFAIARSGVFVASNWGVERVFSVVGGGGAALWNPPVWGFAIPFNQQALINGSLIGGARPTVASVAANVTVGLGMEYLINSAAIFGSIKPELQGAEGYPIYPLTIATNNVVGNRGKLGNLFDWWQGRTSGAVDGDLYGTFQLLGLTGIDGVNNGSLLWPWDGVTAPVLT